jgi:hypothetical protein
MRSRTIEDRSVGTGVFTGDLKYGRMFGKNFEKHKDFAAEHVNGIAQNQPVVPLITVQPRDPNCWKKDPSVKQAKRVVDNSQHSVNYIVQSYREMLNHMKANIHITVGRQRL